METGVVEHGADLGGLLQVSCTSGQSSLSWVFLPPRPHGVRLDLNKVTHDGFPQPKDSVHGGGACGSG